MQKNSLCEEGSISVEELLGPKKDRGHMYIIKVKKMMITR